MLVQNNQVISFAKIAFSLTFISLVSFAVNSTDTELTQVIRLQISLLVSQKYSIFIHRNTYELVIRMVAKLVVLAMG